MDIFRAARTGNNQRIVELLNKGVDIDAKNNDEWTALMIASRRSNDTSSLDTVKLLLDRGADINSKDNDGWTALILASRRSNDGSSLETVKLLLDHKADVNIQNNNGITALMFAAGESNHNSSLDTVKLLLDHKANVNIQDNIGMTALMYSSKLSNRESSLDTIKILLDHGADPFILNVKKESAIDLYPNAGCKDILSKVIWERLYSRDINTAERYSKGGDIPLPKDVWELILLNKRQQELCKDLSTDKNIKILLLFALELGIPIDENITKAKLCGLISRQLAYGKYYSEASKKYTDEKIREDINNIKMAAVRFGIDPNRPIDKVLGDLSKILK